MFKKITAAFLIIGMLILPGCGKKSNFQVHSDNFAKRSLYDNKAQKESLKYAFQALSKIMKFYEDQTTGNIKEQSNKSLFTYTAYDKTGRNVVGIYEVADVTSGYVSIINNMTISNSRERVIREFTPIFEGITKRMISEGNAPKSWIDVASEFVKHVPMMASMGAMYGLTSMAIDKAGNTINANLASGAELNNINTSGNGNNVAAEGSLIHTSDDDMATRDYSQDSGNTSTEIVPAVE